MGGDSEKPMLVQEQTVPQMKALIFSFLEPEGQCLGIIMGAQHSLPIKKVYEHEEDKSITSCAKQG